MPNGFLSKNSRISKQYFLNIIVLILLLGGLYIFVFFISKKINLWERESENHLVFKNVFPKLIDYYQAGDFKKIETIIHSYDKNEFSKKEKFKFHIFIASVYKKQGYYLSALRNINLAHQYYTTSFSQTLKGMVLEKMGEKKLAKNNYIQAIQSDKKYYPAYEKLGDISYRQHAFESSVEYYKQAQLFALEGNNSTGNNFNLLKKVFSEYLNNQSIMTQISFNKMNLFEETRFISFFSIIKGLIQFENQQKISPINTKQSKTFFFNEAVKISSEVNKKYYLTFGAMYNYYLENVEIGEKTLMRIVDKFPQMNLFHSIIYETLGDGALRKKNYELSKYFYSMIKHRQIKNDASLINKLSIINMRRNNQIKPPYFVITNINDLNVTKKHEFTELNMDLLINLLKKKSDFKKLIEHLNFQNFIKFSAYLEKKKHQEKLYYLMFFYLKKHSQSPSFIYKKIGDIAYHKNLYDDAIKWYKKAIRQSGDIMIISKSFNNLAKIYIDNNNKSKARQYISTGLKYKRLPSLYFNLALIQKSDGKLKDYSLSIKKANSFLNNNDYNKVGARIYLELSLIYTYTKYDERAEFFLNKAKKIDFGYAKKYSWGDNNLYF